MQVKSVIRTMKWGLVTVNGAWDAYQNFAIFRSSKNSCAHLGWKPAKHESFKGLLARWL
jgi:hypothetical protein